MRNLTFGSVMRRLATLISVSILALSLIAAVTGILLSLYYQPSAGGAYDSLRWITTEVPYGAIIRRLHDIAGNWIIGVSLMQIVVMFLGERLRRSWLTAWVSGIALTLTAIGLSWTAILLDWNQIGYWRFRIELGTIESIPLIGASLRNFVTGGGAVSTLTVERLYTLHSYVLPIVALCLAIVHLSGLLVQEREVKRETGTQPSDKLGAGSLS
jgi:cytochrome b6